MMYEKRDFIMDQPSISRPERPKSPAFNPTRHQSELEGQPVASSSKPKRTLDAPENAPTETRPSKRPKYELAKEDLQLIEDLTDKDISEAADRIIKRWNKPNESHTSQEEGIRRIKAVSAFIIENIKDASDEERVDYIRRHFDKG